MRAGRHWLQATPLMLVAGAAWAASSSGAAVPARAEGLAAWQQVYSVLTHARCINCHTGFAFTDHGFYDIGLPSEDLGRGPIIKLPAADHAFKTPTLRELAWTAPYMHDGSLATLEEVVRHYEKGGVRRPTRSRDLTHSLRLMDRERADLVAFLKVF